MTDLAYKSLYHRTRYRADPAYREADRIRQRRHRRRRAAENAECRRWRARSVARALSRLKAAGWSYARIGGAIGAHKQLVYRWATGRHLPTPRYAAALSRLAGTVGETWASS